MPPLEIGFRLRESFWQSFTAQRQFSLEDTVGSLIWQNKSVALAVGDLRASIIISIWTRSVCTWHYAVCYQSYSNHTPRPIAISRGQWTRGVSRRPCFFFGEVGSVVLLPGSIRRFLACLAHEEEEDRHAAWKGKEGGCQQKSRLFLASPHRCCDRFAEPVKTEAVELERTVLLRLPCLSASPHQPWSWPTCVQP
jgi:hypothetical protein